MEKETKETGGRGEWKKGRWRNGRRDKGDET
jgi:hypothetical protein